MVTAARAGGRAIPELWPLGTEVLALAMEVSVLEAKRLGHRAVLRLSWAATGRLRGLVHPPPGRRRPTHPGRLPDRRRHTPVWLLGSFAVLSLLYRADTSADPAMASVEIGAEPSPNSADRLPTSTEAQQSGAEVLAKRAHAERIYADLSADGASVSAGQLAAWPWPRPCWLSPGSAPSAPPSC